MKIIARHERDDQDVELGPEEELALEEKMNISPFRLAQAGITQFERTDGWLYRLVH